MKNALVCTLMLISFTAFSQSGEWTKSDAQFLYDEAMNLVSKYPLKPDQRESIAICYKDETVKKFTKTDYNLKIEAELKRIRENCLNQCAKNLGIELNEEKPVKADTVKVAPKESELSKKYLSDSWEFEEGVLNLYPDGEFKINLPNGVIKECRGKWLVTEKILSTTSTWCGSDEYEIVSFSPDSFVAYRKSGRKLFHFARKK